MKTAEEILDYHLNKDSMGVQLWQKDRIIHAMQEYSDLTNAKLVEENERLWKEKENQRSTIISWQNVYKKHFGLDDMACSENLESKITESKSRNKLIKLQSELSAAKERVIELEQNRNTNLELLIDVAEYLTTAEDKEMNQYELENYIETLGYKLELALKNYKVKPTIPPKQHG